MKNLLTLSLIILTGVLSNVFANEVVTLDSNTVNSYITNDNDEPKLKIIKRKKLVKFFNSEAFDTDGSKASYAKKFGSFTNVDDVDFYKDKKTKEIVLVFRNRKKDTVVRTGDYL